MEFPEARKRTTTPNRPFQGSGLPTFFPLLPVGGGLFFQKENL